MIIKLNILRFWKILLYQAYFLQLAVSAPDSSDIERLRAKILDNYDKYSRPVQKHNDTVEVYIYFINYGFETDEKRGIFTLHALSVMDWIDQHLTWDPWSYGNITEIQFTPTELWLPDLSVINNFDQSEIDHFGGVPIWVATDSRVRWFAPSKFQVHCPFDYRLWPYDKQTCVIHISSWTHYGEEIELNILHDELWLDPESYHSYTDNREWAISSTHVQQTRLVLFCCPEITYTSIVVTVDIQRKFSGHTVAITAVGLGLASAILISFWLDPFAQERLPLTLLILLLNSVYLQYLHQTVPNNGDSVPLTICFFRDSLIMATYAFTWTIGIRYLAKTKRNSPVPIPPFIQTFLNSCAATVLCLNPRPQSKGQVQRKMEESSGGEEEDVSELVQDEDSVIQEDWEWLARFLDRIAFLGYLITYTIFIFAFL